MGASDILRFVGIIMIIGAVAGAALGIVGRLTGLPVVVTGGLAGAIVAVVAAKLHARRL